jgi:hypothetical protein
MIRDWIIRGRCTCAVIVVVERDKWQEDESSERPTSFNKLRRTSSLAQTTSSNVNINVNIRPYTTAPQSARMTD